MKKIYLHGAKDRIARHTTIRDINKRIVLNYVRARSPISRADIARETSLQRSTVSAIVDVLIDAGMIEELGTGDSSGGRRPTLLRLTSGKPVAIGVDITPRHTKVVLADLSGNLLSEESFPTSPDIDYMNDQILAKVTALASENSEYDLEVGISIPGIADQINGNILYIPYFQWSNWDIGQQITNATSLPVTIDNDANAVAVAELWFGALDVRRTHNFITVLISEGIGTGIVIDGAVYRGENGGAGEFGHMYVGSNAPVACSCGRRDCWEAHASEKAALSRYRTNGGTSDAALVDMEHLISLAENGEKHAINALKDTATYLAIGISNLIVGFSPKMILVSGRIVRAWDLIKEEIRVQGNRSIRQELNGTLIVPSALSESPTTLGSISLVLSKKFVSAT